MGGVGGGCCCDGGDCGVSLSGFSSAGAASDGRSSADVSRAARVAVFDAHDQCDAAAAMRIVSRIDRRVGVGLTPSFYRKAAPADTSIAMPRRVLAIATLLLLLPMFLPRVARAHATVENAMQVVVSRERVALELRVTLEQVDVAHEIPNAVGSESIDPAKLDAALKQHADYLLKHLDVRADDRLLTGTVTRIIAQSLRGA